MLLVDIGVCATGVGTLITALTGWRNGRAIAHNSREIGRVHNAVNGASQDLIARTDQLTASLTEAGVTVPDRPAPTATTDAVSIDDGTTET
jgi:hypothetical protein